MALLVLGILLFAGIHFIPSLAPGLKASWLGRLGENGYKGTFALLALASFRNFYTRPLPRYATPLCCCWLSLSC